MSYKKFITVDNGLREKYFNFIELMMPFIQQIGSPLDSEYKEKGFDETRLFNMIKSTFKLFKGVNKKIKFQKFEFEKIYLFLIHSREVVVTDKLRNRTIIHHSSTGNFLFVQNNENIDFSTNFEKIKIKIPKIELNDNKMNFDLLEKASEDIVSYKIMTSKYLLLFKQNSIISKNFNKIDIKIPSLIDCLTTPLVINIISNLASDEVQIQGDDRIKIKHSNDFDIEISVDVKDLPYGENNISGKLIVDEIPIPLHFNINKIESIVYLYSPGHTFFIGDDGIPRFVNKQIPYIKIDIYTLDSQFNAIHNEVVVYDDEFKIKAFNSNVTIDDIKKNRNLIKDELQIVSGKFGSVIFAKKDMKNYGTVYLSKDFYSNIYFDFNYQNSKIKYINPLTNEFEDIPDHIYAGALRFQYKFKIDSNTKPVVHCNVRFMIYDEMYSNGIFSFYLTQRYASMNTGQIAIKYQNNEIVEIPVFPADGKISVKDNLLSFEWSDDYLNNYESVYYVKKTNEWRKIEPKMPIEIEQNKYIIVSPFTYIWISLNEPNIDCVIDLNSPKFFPIHVKNAAFYVLEKSTKQPKIVHINDFDPEQMICIVGQLCDSIEDISNHPEKYKKAWVPNMHPIVRRIMQSKSFDEVYSIYDSVFSFIREPKQGLIKLKRFRDVYRLLNYIKEQFIIRRRMIRKVKLMLSIPCKLDYLHEAQDIVSNLYNGDLPIQENPIEQKFDVKEPNPSQTYEVLKITKTAIEGLMMSDVSKFLPMIVCDFGMDDSGALIYSSLTAFKTITGKLRNNELYPYEELYKNDRRNCLLPFEFITYPQGEFPEAIIEHITHENDDKPTHIANDDRSFPIANDENEEETYNEYYSDIDLSDIYL